MPDNFTRALASDWKSSEYYKMAEGAEHMSLFWASESPFRVLFTRLGLARVVELACGHGRHLPRYFGEAGHVTLIDVNRENIDACRSRHGNLPKNRLAMFVNNGSDLACLRSASQTSLFCYDAMVHFELLDVASYLREIYRVLLPGSLALLHHSNFSGNVGGIYNRSHEFGWRNYMTCDLFSHLAMRSGFKVVSQQTLEWGGVANLDGLTLLQGPTRVHG